MRFHLAAGALAASVMLAACQSSGELRYPDEPNGYSSLSDQQIATAPEPYVPPLQPSLAPAEEHPEAGAAASNPPPPPPVLVPVPDKEPVIRPYSNLTANTAMDQEETELRAALGEPGVVMMRDGVNLVVELESDSVFEPNSAILTPEGRDMVLAMSRVVRRYPDTYINIDGFTDTTGSPESNITLSQDRADAVADVLADDGVETKRLSAVGHGEDYPKVPTGDGVSEPQNRRVEITLEPYAG